MRPFTIAVVLFKPRFPENIGMAARACANFGCADLRLVAPERWDFLKAKPLATSQGVPILKNIRIYPDLAPAIAEEDIAVATSARVGSRRSGALEPEAMARQLAAANCKKIALVFGPEDRGLTNAELCQCQKLVHIPASTNAPSFNLAQAVLLLLYEFSKPAMIARSDTNSQKFITTGEWQLLAASFKNLLAGLDCPSGKNPDYFFKQWAGIFRNGRLTRQEFDTLMGFSRQIANKLTKGQK